MKRKLILVAILVLIIMAIVSVMPTKTYAKSVLDEKTESRLVEIKESQAKSLEEYQKKYDSEAYGFTAYILHVVQVYSIPFCFLGIVISLIYKVVIGKRNIENAEKGLGLIIAVVTITIICQVLPLVFAVVVKIGKG